MTTIFPSDDDSQEKLMESTKEKFERPKKLESLIDTQAMRFLEGMDFNSFNNLSGAIEQFMAEAPLFQSDVSFSNAAMALDLTAALFPTIDTDGNHLLSREEFAYLLLKTNDANRQALAWLTENFNAFTRACFFKDQIGKDDIEAARNVFHGLKVVNEKFGFDKQPTSENLSTLDPDKIQALLDNDRGTLNPHEIAGLKYVLDHIKKHGAADATADGKSEKGSEKNTQADDKRLQVLDGILDARSLKTLQSLHLNNFESTFYAFAEFIENKLSFKGDTPFTKASNAFDSTANIVSDLGMGGEHSFTRDELLIVSRMTTSPDKPQVSWVAKHFDAFTKALFFSGKAKKKDLLAASNVFNGLGFVRAAFNTEKPSEMKLEQQVRDYLKAHRATLDEKNKVGMEQLVDFMERHAK